MHWSTQHLTLNMLKRIMQGSSPSSDFNLPDIDENYQSFLESKTQELA